MRWTPGRRSRNLEDRRTEGGRRRLRFPRAGGGGRLPRGRMSLGGIVALVVVSYALGIDPLTLLGGTSVQIPDGGASFDVASRSPSQAPTSEAEERTVDFVSFVLDDAQATWKQLLPVYRDAQLVLFRDSIDSVCGFAASAVGPFYCPGDQKVYIDLAFYRELGDRFGAPGDFAQAYVLAHEIGHHVQTQLGIESEVRSSQRARPSERNDLSVRMELQADCFAGVWAHSTRRRDLLEQGDVEEGMAAAAAVGDDRIQRQTGGRVQPDAFTHGSSQQRVTWFRRGLASGDPASCDTFQTASP